MLGCDTVDDTDLYVSFRKPVKTMGMSEEKMQTNFDYAVDFWRNFLSEHRADGLELEAVPDPEPLPDEYAEYEEDTDKLWQSNIFGKSLYDLVTDGLNTKIQRMPDDARQKLTKTLSRMINENTGGMICILL